MVDEPTKIAPVKERPKIKYKKPKPKKIIKKVIIEEPKEDAVSDRYKEITDLRESIDSKLKELSKEGEEKTAKLINRLNHNSLFNKVKLNKPKPEATTDRLMFKLYTK
jgi:acetyl-CoA carboxylase alpha subunit